jgi:NAD-dependent deacetylase
MDDEALRAAAERARARLAGKRRLLFITGAGLSAESGLPTYRGIGGLYEDAQTEHGMPIEVALSGPMFARAPHVTWHHIGAIEQALRGARHNLAHSIIATLEQHYEVVVLTQNVDGFHRAAGSTRVIDIHGDCHDLQCTRCDHRERRADYAGMTLPPVCPACGAVVRPDVVLFEEALPPRKVALLLHELERGFDAYFSVGTTSVFPYIAQPMLDAARRGLLTVEINPGVTEISELCEVRFACGAARALTVLFPDSSASA